MFEKLKSTYQGKKIFLTGHTGFKGAWLLKVLSMLGAEVKGYALAPENVFDLFCVLKGDSLCESIISDIRDKESLSKAVTSFQPDFVFHLAAQPLVRLSYKIPAETFEVNAIGTANLLDAIRLLQKPCTAVLITTDKVYYNNEWLYPYRENDRLGGYDPYSASKACAEMVIDSYRNSFFNTKQYNDHKKGIAVGRAGNVIGGGDWAMDRLIPDIIRSLSKNQKIEIRNPSAVRPWQHVLEPISGYLMLGAKLAEAGVNYSEAFNFGPQINDALPVSKMVEQAISCWGAGEFFVSQTVNQPHEAGLLKLDISKVINELGWQPKFNTMQALSFTINWYKQFETDKQGIKKFTEQQIIEYLNQ
jgi:CDP-glucose 4,6-dehydratase